MRKNFGTGLVCLSLLFMFGCGKSVEQKQLEEASEKMAEAGKKK